MTYYRSTPRRSAGEKLARIVLWTLGVFGFGIACLFLLGAGLFLAGVIEAYG